MTPPYRIRPGRRSDLPAVAGLYAACFAHDAIVAALFPTHRRRPRDFALHMRRHYRRRWWTPGWLLTVVVGADDVPVGFAWWKRPSDAVARDDSWYSPYLWLAPLMRLQVSLADLAFPTAVRVATAGALDRVLAPVEAALLSAAPPRRLAAAWLLSSLAVVPALQGLGLGAALLRDGLCIVDADAGACWLVAIAGVDGFYAGHGFVEVARANVGELAHWEGGGVMFREPGRLVSP